MLFTLGHSTLTAEQFVLAARRMDVIVDTRSHPISHAHPHFNKEEMESWVSELSDRRLTYTWLPELGGWAGRHTADRKLVARMREREVDVAAYGGQGFPKQRIAATRTVIDESPEWTNVGLRDYSWYMATSEFLEAADNLIAVFANKALVLHGALVCCEAQWWRCHRSMIADYLCWRGLDCYHLPSKPPRRQTTPWFKSHSAMLGNRLERYHPEIRKAWREWVSQEQASQSV